MQDDMTASHTTSYNISYLPMPALVHSIPGLVLLLTVVIPQSCLCLHREGRPLSYRNPTWHILPTSARLMYLSVYDNRDSACVPAPSPSPRSSLTHAHRCIGYRNPTFHILPTSARLMYLSNCFRFIFFLLLIFRDIRDANGMAAVGALAE
jgi:hypothetical protein